VIDNAVNIVRALNADEFTETVHVSSGEKVLNVRCGCHSANLALEDLGLENSTFLAFQGEIKLLLQFLRRRPFKSRLPKEGVTLKVPVIHNVKERTYMEAANFVWKHHWTIYRALETA
jgi:hypothetical protein